MDAETFDYPGTAASALARLDEVCRLRRRSLGDAGLAEPQGHRSPPGFAHALVARVVPCMSVEAFHHGADVCLLRAHYRMSPGPMAGPPTSAGAG